jgi:dienelactone hydrolase
MRTLTLCALLVCLLPSWALAQFDIRAATSQAPDLKFPEAPKPLGSFGSLEMAIYKPDGAGPFPALVLVHTCGGLRSEIQDWAKDALARGYVAFVIDSLGPRGVKSVCIPPSPVNIWRGAKDAFQALEHLQRFDFVDQSRIGLVGFSWGAMVGLLVNSRAVAEALSPSRRFASVVSFYPACYFSTPRGNVEFLRPDTDRPTLVLMGELDNETPPADCLPRLEALKRKDAPVRWHLYPKATHCWDCASLDNLTKTDFQGNRVTYRYDRAITRDSARRAFEFLASPASPAP